MNVLLLIVHKNNVCQVTEVSLFWKKRSLEFSNILNASEQNNRQIRTAQVHFKVKYKAPTRRIFLFPPVHRLIYLHLAVSSCHLLGCPSRKFETLETQYPTSIRNQPARRPQLWWGPTSAEYSIMPPLHGSWIGRGSGTSISYKRGSRLCTDLWECYQNRIMVTCIIGGGCEIRTHMSRCSLVSRTSANAYSALCRILLGRGDSNFLSLPDGLRSEHCAWTSSTLSTNAWYPWLGGCGQQPKH